MAMALERQDRLGAPVRPLSTRNLKLFSAREQNYETITGGRRMIMLKSRIEYIAGSATSEAPSPALGEGDGSRDDPDDGPRPRASKMYVRPRFLCYWSGSWWLQKN